MKNTVSVLSKNGSRDLVVVDEPEVCPHCGKFMSPRLVEAFNLNTPFEELLNILTVYCCTFSDCHKFFALHYKRQFSNNNFTEAEKYYYRPPINVNLPENIEKVSPMFVEIYKEAVQAEQDGLDNIAGVGYRKAAEFLIKDYAISKNPDQEDQVKKMYLGNVISEYLGDFPKVQSLARAVAWIGNDETHYVRKHNDKDIQDLKKFILATAQFLAADYDADEAAIFTSSDNP